MRGDELERVAYPPPRDLLAGGGAFVEGGGNGASVGGGAFVEAGGALVGGGGAPVEIGAASEFGGAALMGFTLPLINPAAPRPPAITTKSSISNTRFMLGMFRFNPVGLSSCFMTTLQLQSRIAHHAHHCNLGKYRRDTWPTQLGLWSLASIGRDFRLLSNML
jgi:hypothetical protein